MKRLFINISMALLLLLLQSCIKEDSSICESGLLLKFRYTLNDQYTNLFYPEVRRVTVYVFDSNGKYVDTFSEQGSMLTNDYVMRLPLPEGTYSAVVYGGDFTTYSAGELNKETNQLNEALRRGVSDVNDFRAELESKNGTGNYLYPLSTPDDLYAGLAKTAVSTPINPIVTEIDLIKDTKKIKVKMSGTDPVAKPLDVYITAKNGRYLYDNSLDQTHGTFMFLPIHSSATSNSMEVDLKIMRLMLGGLPMLVIKDKATQDVILSKNIIDLILLTGKYKTQEDFDREDEFVFEITLGSYANNFVISISINGWKINEVTPDI